MANFDTNRLFNFIQTEIASFSKKHPDETFYGFAIDANLICLNSLEKFRDTLQNYQDKWHSHKTEEEIRDLKKNTGDWTYQGFAKFSDNDGFDMASYLEHYHADDEDQINSEYAKAMDNLIVLLKKSDIFKNINKTQDFYICRVDHNY